MKKILTLTLCLATLLLGSCKKIKLSGETITKTMAVESYNAVSVDEGIALTIDPAATEIKIETDKNLLDQVEVYRYSDGRYVIQYKKIIVIKGGKSKRGITKVTLPYDDRLKTITAKLEGTCKVKNNADGTLRFDQLSVTVENLYSTVDVDAKVQELTVNCSDYAEFGDEYYHTMVLRNLNVELSDNAQAYIAIEGCAVRGSVTENSLLRCSGFNYTTWTVTHDDTSRVLRNGERID